MCYILGVAYNNQGVIYNQFSWGYLHKVVPSICVWATWPFVWAADALWLWREAGVGDIFYGDVSWDLYI